jgi:hypothetical protein
LTSRSRTRFIYRGWFYVVGSVEHGPDSWIGLEDGKWERRFYRVTPTFEVGFATKEENVPEVSGDGLALK